MSLLLYFVAKLIFFSLFAIVVLVLLTWLTKKAKRDFQDATDFRRVAGR